MSDNPFSKIVTVIREDNKAPAGYRFGTVTSVSPLTVDVAGNSQDDSSLLKNYALVSFEIGDRLLLIPIEDEQRYIVLCKVVSV